MSDIFIRNFITRILSGRGYAIIKNRKYTNIINIEKKKCFITLDGPYYPTDFLIVDDSIDVREINFDVDKDTIFDLDSLYNHHRYDSMYELSIYIIDLKKFIDEMPDNDFFYRTLKEQFRAVVSIVFKNDLIKKFDELESEWIVQKMRENYYRNLLEFNYVEYNPTILNTSSKQINNESITPVNNEPVKTYTILKKN